MHLLCIKVATLAAYFAVSRSHACGHQGMVCCSFAAFAAGISAAQVTRLCVHCLLSSLLLFCIHRCNFSTLFTDTR